MATNNAAPGDFSLSLVRSSNTLTDWRLRIDPPEKDDFMSQYLKHQYPINPVYEQPVPLESVFKADARRRVIPALQCSHPYPHCESSCSSFKPEIEDIEIPEELKANVNAAHESNFELKMKSFDSYEGLKEEFLDKPQWPPENPDFNSFYVFLPESEIVERNEFATVKGESVDSGERHKRVCPIKSGVSVRASKAMAELKNHDKGEDEGEEVDDDWIPNTYTVGLFSKTHDVDADKKGVAPVARKPPNPIRRKDKGKEEIMTVEDVLNMFAEPDPWRRMLEEDDDDVDMDRDYIDEYGYGYGGQWDPYEGEIGWDLWWGRRGGASTSTPDPVYESESEWNEDEEDDEDKSEDARLFLRVYHDAKEDWEDWEEEDESDDAYASSDSDSEVAGEQGDQMMKVWLSGGSMQALSILKAQKLTSLKMDGRWKA